MVDDVHDPGSPNGRGLNKRRVSIFARLGGQRVLTQGDIASGKEDIFLVPSALVGHLVVSDPQRGCHIALSRRGSSTDFLKLLTP